MPSRPDQDTSSSPDPLASLDARTARATGLETKEADKLLVSALEDLYWDDNANQYWRFYGDEASVIRTKEDLRLHLKLRGVSDQIPKGQQVSSVDRAIGLIQATRRVKGAGPFLYCPDKIVTHMGRPYVNTSMVRPLPPAEGPHTWGDGFPWLAQYLTNLFSDRSEQFDVFQAWVAHFYHQALAGTPSTGMALVIAGPTSIGKNFLGTAVLGQLFGGCRDASDYILGLDQFNSALGDTPLWTMHDAALNDPKTRDNFSQRLKRIVANRELIVRAMHREGVNLPWNGRVILTMNLDAESLRMVPNMDISNLEKLLLLRAQPAGMGRFPSDAEMRKELPHWGAWLRDYQIPEALASERFGVRHWHHPDLYEAAQAESGTASAQEILDLFREHFFEGVDPAIREWRDTVTRLYVDLTESNLNMSQAASRLFRSPIALGAAVSKLEALGVPWIRKERATGVDRRRLVVIQRPVKGNT